MNTLLDHRGRPTSEARTIEYPDLVPSQEEIDAWRREFEREKTRTESERHKHFLLNQNWGGLANPLSQVVTGAAYASSNAITNVGPAPDYTIPAGMVPGTVFRLTARGIYSTTGTPTLTLQFMYGGTGGTSLFTSGAATSINNAASTPWMMEAFVRVLTAGTAGTVCVFGSIMGLTTATSLALVDSTSVSINTTTANTLIVAATWGTANASNTLTDYIYTIEQLN